MVKISIFLFWVVILICLAPNAISIYEELLFSDTVEDGDAVNISGKEFEFRIDPQSSKVLIEADGSGLIVENGECKIKDSLDICVQNVSFSYRNYEPWYDVYKAEVKVYQIKSKLDVTHTASNENILIDEEATGILSFENSADVPSKDVTANMPIPPNLEITEIEGCKKTGGNILFKEDVNPRQTRMCTYKFKGVYPGDYKLVANITYFDGVEAKSAVSGALKGKVYNYSLVIKYGLNKIKFDIGEKFNLTISVENINDEHDLSVKALSIKLPEKILLVNKPKDTSGSSRLISWSGALKAKESLNFTMELQSLVTGKYDIISEASYKIDKFLNKAEKSLGMNITCNCPSIEHDFSQNIVVAWQRAVLTADLASTGTNDFKNVRISYLTNIPGIEPSSVAYSSIRPWERIRIFDSSVVAPDLGEEYYLNITASYESQFGEVFIKKKSIPIKVLESKSIVPVEKENQTEEKKEENVSLGSEDTSGDIKEEDSKEEQNSGEVPVTTLQDEKKSPLMAYAVVGIILVLIISFVFLRKIKREKEPAEQPVAPVEPEEEPK